MYPVLLVVLLLIAIVYSNCEQQDEEKFEEESSFGTFTRNLESSATPAFKGLSISPEAKETAAELC